MRERKLYYAVRTDLSVPQRSVQLIHAREEFAFLFENPPRRNSTEVCTAVVYKVPGKQSLQVAFDAIYQEGENDVAMFHESSRGDEPTALCTSTRPPKYLELELL